MKNQNKKNHESSLQIANHIIDSLLAKVDNQLRGKSIGFKLAPISVRKSAIYAMQSMAIMQSEYLQLPETINKPTKVEGIKMDRFTSNKVKKKSQQEINCMPLISNNISRDNKIETKKINLKSQGIEDSRDLFLNKKNKFKSSKASKIMSENKIGGSSVDDAESAEIERVRNRKFFIEEQQSLQQSIIQKRVKQLQQAFEEKQKKFKSMKNKQLAYDYSGQTLQANSTQSKQISLFELKAGTPFTQTPKAKKVNFRQKIKTEIVRKDPSFEKLKTSQIEQLQLIFGKGVDPVSQVGDDNLSEGVKIIQTQSNICKQKRQIKKKNHFSLKEYKQLIRKNNFKEFANSQTFNSRLKTISHHQQSAILQRTDDYRSLKPSAKSSKQASILYRTTDNRNKSRYGKIKVGSISFFQELLEGDSTIM